MGGIKSDEDICRVFDVGALICLYREYGPAK